MTVQEDIRTAAALLERAAEEDITPTQRDVARHLAGLAIALADSIKTLDETRLVTDGGQDRELTRIRRAVERTKDHQERQADALEALAEQTEIQNAVLFQLVRELERRNTVAVGLPPDETSTPERTATDVADGVLHLAERVDVEDARRWADECY